ncbi:MAG: alcohol dehydrogenase catalytic domain-containing protein [Candidatus Rokubacteria bacterium]|nr:alcohol dehydrogenase catalytic domain-containing protein [Candidatus Rokubacteria bacterium]
MKAVVFYGPGDLRFADVPMPRPKPGEVLVRVDAALTCGTDVKTYRRGHPVMIPVIPTIFGHELAGTIVEVGPGVQGVREGDRVVAANSAPCGACSSCQRGRANLCEDLFFWNGAFAEYALIPRRVTGVNLQKISDSLPARHGAFAEPLACALHALSLAEIRVGDQVVIFGHGPLGQLLGLLAIHQGGRVLLIGKPGPRFDRARGHGFECLESLPDVVPAVRKVTGGQGADVAIDATGRPEVWEQAVTSTRRGGTTVFFGGCAPGTEVRLDTRRLHYEELKLVGAFHHTPSGIRRAISLLESGAINPDVLVTHEMRLSEVPEALELMARGLALKVLIQP